VIEINETATLSDMVRISAGYPFRGKVPEVDGGTTLVVQMKDTSPDDGIHWSQCARTELKNPRSEACLLSGDILFAARGSHHYAVLVDQTITSLQLSAVASPHFFVLRPMQINLLPEYLCWFLNQKPCQRYFQQNAEGSVTKSIRRSALGATQISVPSSEKQHVIVQLATTINEERKSAESLIDNGRQLMSALAADLLKARQTNQPKESQDHWRATKKNRGSNG